MRKPLLLLILILFTLHGGSQTESPSKLGIHIKPLTILNSPQKETNISITPNDKYMFFMSARGGNRWNTKNQISTTDNKYDGDIYYSVKKNGIWSAPINMGSPPNSDKGEDEPMISPDGKKVIFQSWRWDWEDTGGPYYMVKLIGKRWTRPIGLGGGINQFFKEEFKKYNQYGTDGASWSQDGKKIIFSCGQDYYGNFDLYMSTKTENGEWGYLQKLSLSTPGNERSAYLAADGKTLYFSSDGYDGYGGLDIFKTVLDKKGNFTEVINLGPEVNSTEDDYGFVMNASGKEAYFVRNGDIYQIVFDKPIKRIAPQPTALILGKVRGLPYSIKTTDYILINPITKDTVSRGTLDLDQGTFSLFLNEIKDDLKIVIQPKNFPTQEGTINFDPAKIYNEIKLDLLMEMDELYGPIHRRKSNNVVYFSYKSSELNHQSKLQLRKLKSTYDQFELNSITLFGFPDLEGTIENNGRLSLNRANRVKEFFVQLGVPENQITIKNYPFVQDYNSRMNTPLTHHLCRIVEIRIEPSYAKASADKAD